MAPGRGVLPPPVAEICHRIVEFPDSAHLRLTAVIAELDRMISAQLGAIIAHPGFRALEASWRSLEYVVREIPARDPLIFVRVLNATREELLDDIEDAIEFDRSALFHHVYEHEFGMYGGSPYSILVVDFEFSSGGEDVALLRGISGVAAAAHAVALAGASPELLGLRHWTDLTPHRVPNDLEGPPFAAWSSLCRSADARYVGLCLPRCLLRAPYRQSDPYRSLPLREDSFAADGSGLVWGNAAFALAVRIMHAFRDYRWCAPIRGLRYDWGVATGLEETSFWMDREGLVVSPPVDVVVTEAEEKALADLGLISLVRVAGSPRVAFFNIPSLHRPPVVDDAAITSNLRLSAQIPYMLIASRFAHYFKVIMRDRTGSALTPLEIQRELSNWMAKYTMAVGGSRHLEAQYPLREFSIEVREKAGKPGHLEAVTNLRPHYQIEDPGVGLRLTVDLPEPAKRK